MTILTDDEARFLSHYSTDSLWIFDAASLSDRLYGLIDRGLLEHDGLAEHAPGHRLTAAGAAALAEHAGR